MVYHMHEPKLSKSFQLVQRDQLHQYVTAYLSMWFNHRIAKIPEFSSFGAILPNSRLSEEVSRNFWYETDNEKLGMFDMCQQLITLHVRDQSFSTTHPVAVTSIPSRIAACWYYQFYGHCDPWPCAQEHLHAVTWPFFVVLRTSPAC